MRGGNRIALIGASLAAAALGVGHSTGTVIPPPERMVDYDYPQSDARPKKKRHPRPKLKRNRLHLSRRTKRKHRRQARG